MALSVPFSTMRPPFFANPDAHSCLQSTLRMALSACGISPAPTHDEMVALTRKQPGEGTWTHGAYLALGALNVDARAIDSFDYESFVNDPTATVFRTFPEEIASAMAAGFDLVTAAGLATEMLESKPIPIERRSPSMQDIERFLEEGWLLIANVAARDAERSTGDVGHSVLIYRMNAAAVVFHDPGEHGRGTEGVAMLRGEFNQAWSYMGEGHRELIAVRARRTD